ncbi:MAG TPA: arginine repressor [Clostridiales bacterium]|nr:arginine repressor [Clostridiales bacterium]
MGKNKRQQIVLDIISKTEVNTQEELLSILAEKGLAVTQATVSRDIKDLGLVKTTGLVKKYRYVLPDEARAGGKVAEQFRHAVKNVLKAMNMVVIKTITGNGNAVAALIDNMNIEWIVGTIAGDDTVFAVAKSEDDADKIIAELTALL